MRSDKYNSFPESDREKIINNATINIADITIKNPDNPARLLNAKLITLDIV